MICRSYNDFFLNFANKANIAIITELQKESLPVKELVKRTGREQSAVSHSLKKLSACNIVMVRKKGREHIYSLNQETVVPLLELVTLHVKKNCRRCSHV